jgi:hypothetical protein
MSAKHGRNKKRPAQQRYVSERRSERNKRRNIERATRARDAATAKHIRRAKAGKPYRGKARHERRHGGMK